jgi:lipopolysaccharide/colanic/teichoic acid biosynthesis glycosyltransferase
MTFPFKENSLNDPTIKIFKRLFDIIFRLLLLVFVLVDATFGDFNKT